MTESEAIRLERLALLIGQFVGQTAELLNQINRKKLSMSEIYQSLLDINQAAALHAHELYYKGNAP
jgi:hypothetical protein